MIKNETSAAYFEWLCSFVCVGYRWDGLSYKKLLNRLSEIDFQFSIAMDANREADGLDLRYRFGNEKHIRNYIINRYLDDHPCSVLEMMVALANRCEETIMDDPEYGDRRGQWFWGMITNLGLAGMDDRKFDEMYVDEKINAFMNHEYSRNGEGGLFYVRKPYTDMRQVEIWMQLNWYLDEYEVE